MGEGASRLQFCQVIVDIAHEEVDRVFTYRIPEGMAIVPGMRVHVPFGRMKRVEGIVIRLEEQCDVPEEKIREIQEPLEDYPAILPQMLDLAEYLHRTSFCAMAQALRLLYPSEMRKGRVTEKKREVAVLTVQPEIREQVRRAQLRAPKRAAVLEALERAEGNEAETAALRRELGECRGALQALARAGFVRLEQREVLRRPYGAMEALSSADPELTAEQKDVLTQLLPAVQTGSGCFLLYGVTGSGKTEVFIRAVRAAAALGKTAIVLVPEIALTPQMVCWFRSRFGEDAAVLHSRLSPGERYDEWRRIRRGEVRVVIGARSAVFAPLERVGLIIVDEEHEQTYQAENVPQYDARDLARRRCENEGATLLLASATPSLRSFALAQRGDLVLLEMPSRVSGRPLPAVHIVDMREELRQGNRSVFSGALLDGLTNCMKAGKQAILFVNRRGYSTFVSCRSCGYTIRLPGVRQPVHPLFRHGDAARGGGGAQALSRRPGAADGQRHHEGQGRARSHPGAVPLRCGEDPRRNADDRQGAGFSKRHDGGHRRRGRDAEAAGLPLRGALFPAADPGGRARGQGRHPRRGLPADVRPGSLRDPDGEPAGLQGLLRAGDALPPAGALSALYRHRAPGFRIGRGRAGQTGSPGRRRGDGGVF